MPRYIFVIYLLVRKRVKVCGYTTQHPLLYCFTMDVFYSKPLCEKTGEPIKVCYENHQMSVALSITWGCCKTLRNPLLPFYLKGFLERQKHDRIYDFPVTKDGSNNFVGLVRVCKRS